MPASADAAGIATALLAGSALLPRLHYERLSVTRFRLSIDQQDAFRPLHVAAGDAMRGQPPVEDCVMVSDWCIELDCAGLPAGDL
jgi:hypothetical protein